MKITTIDDARTVSEAFAGIDKMDRIHEKLKSILKNDEGARVSEPIQLAIELYADTTEEAVGIALEMRHLMMVQDKETVLSTLMSDGPPVPTGLRDLFSKMRGMSDFAKSEAHDTLDNEIETLDSMGRHKCEECPVNGSCPIQDEADKHIPEWREGRNL